MTEPLATQPEGYLEAEKQGGHELTYCLYCGAMYPVDGDGRQVHEHIMYQCTKHPIAELRQLANAVVMNWRRDEAMAESLAALELWLRTEH